jgi:hypothetical protein
VRRPDANAALIVVVEAGENPQHGALAAAGWTDEYANLSGIERKVDAGEHVVPLARRVLNVLLAISTSSCTGTPPG